MYIYRWVFSCLGKKPTTPWCSFLVKIPQIFGGFFGKNVTTFFVGFFGKTYSFLVGFFLFGKNPTALWRVFD
jgi:hypothetical protein